MADYLGHGKPVQPHQPVGLIEPILASQGRFIRIWHATAGLADRDKGRVIDPFERLLPVKLICQGQHLEVGLWTGSDDQLGALSGGGKRGHVAQPLAVLARLGDGFANDIHGGQH